MEIENLATPLGSSKTISRKRVYQGRPQESSRVGRLFAICIIAAVTLAPPGHRACAGAMSFQLDGVANGYIVPIVEAQDQTAIIVTNVQSMFSFDWSGPGPFSDTLSLGLTSSIFNINPASSFIGGNYPTYTIGGPGQVDSISGGASYQAPDIPDEIWNFSIEDPSGELFSPPGTGATSDLTVTANVSFYLDWEGNGEFGELEFTAMPAVPEPGSWVLASSGMVILLLFGVRERRKKHMSSQTTSPKHALSQARPTSSCDILSQSLNRRVR